MVKDKKRLSLTLNLGQTLESIALRILSHWKYFDGNNGITVKLGYNKLGYME